MIGFDFPLCLRAFVITDFESVIQNIFTTESSDFTEESQKIFATNEHGCTQIKVKNVRSEWLNKGVETFSISGSKGKKIISDEDWVKNVE